MDALSTLLRKSRITCQISHDTRANPHHTTLPELSKINDTTLPVRWKHTIPAQPNVELLQPQLLSTASSNPNQAHQEGIEQLAPEIYQGNCLLQEESCIGWRKEVRSRIKIYTYIYIYRYRHRNRTDIDTNGYPRTSSADVGAGFASVSTHNFPQYFSFTLLHHTNNIHLSLSRPF